MLWVVGVVGAIVIMVVVHRFTWTGKPAQRRGVASLRARYFRVVRMPRPMAEAALERHLTTWRARSPGQSDAWYLRRVLDDLDRDRS